MHQRDVSTAYLNSELDDEVYMEQPEGFINSKYPNRVLQLKKAIYGLKQSGREWNRRLDTTLKSIGFKQCHNEPCLYKENVDKKDNFIAVYVDDIIVACSSETDLLAIKKKIAESFNIVDKGRVQHFLGMEIERVGSIGPISVGHSQYVQNLLKQYGMEQCRGASTPLDPEFKIQCTTNDCEKVNATEYQSLIGALMYLAVTTRPDILHSVSKLAQRNCDPHIEHETAAKHILRYLSVTKNLKLNFRKTGKQAEDFSWESKKQVTVALSTTEAEYMALSAAAKEAVYLRKLLYEMNCHEGVGPFTMYGDNLSSQHLARNPVYHNRSKHIDIRFHFIREVVKNNVINLKMQICQQIF